MATKTEVQDLNLQRSEDLCKLAELLGYRRRLYGQLTNNNGSEVSSLLDFFDDNPGALDAVREWVLENHREWDTECEEEEECEDDEESENDETSST